MTDPKDTPVVKEGSFEDFERELAMNDPADPKFLQEDGDPIREAALPREVVRLLGRYRSALVSGWGEAHGFTGHAAEIAAIDAALTGARPSADAGEVTDEMVDVAWRKLDDVCMSKNFIREMLRAALAAREGRS